MIPHVKYDIAEPAGGAWELAETRKSGGRDHQQMIPRTRHHNYQLIYYPPAYSTRALSAPRHDDEIIIRFYYLQQGKRS